MLIKEFLFRICSIRAGRIYECMSNKFCLNFEKICIAKAIFSFIIEVLNASQIRLSTFARSWSFSSKVSISIKIICPRLASKRSLKHLYWSSKSSKARIRLNRSVKERFSELTSRIREAMKSQAVTKLTVSLWFEAFWEYCLVIGAGYGSFEGFRVYNDLSAGEWLKNGRSLNEPFFGLSYSS